MHGEVEFCNVIHRPAKNNDERAAAAATIISPQRRESISWVGASVQRRAGVHSRNAGGLSHLVLFRNTHRTSAQCEKRWRSIGSISRSLERGMSDLAREKRQIQRQITRRAGPGHSGPTA